MYKATHTSKIRCDEQAYKSAHSFGHAAATSAAAAVTAAGVGCFMIIFVRLLAASSRFSTGSNWRARYVSEAHTNLRVFQTINQHIK